MVWGATGSNDKSAKIKEKLLSPLELNCWGGQSGDKMYHVTNKDNSFDFYFSEEKIIDIEKIYTKWLRKIKLEKINNK